MSLEAMRQVTEAEQTTRAQKAEAEAQAKRLVAEAERDGKAALARARPGRAVLCRAAEAGGGASGSGCGHHSRKGSENGCPLLK